VECGVLRPESGFTKVRGGATLWRGWELLLPKQVERLRQPLFIGLSDK
jgi:hypothetical protein